MYQEITWNANFCLTRRPNWILEQHDLFHPFPDQWLLSAAERSNRLVVRMEDRPTRKDEALTLLTFFIEKLPVPDRAKPHAQEVEEVVRRLIEIVQSLTRIDDVRLLDWLKVEHSDRRSEPETPILLWSLTASPSSPKSARRGARRTR